VKMWKFEGWGAMRVDPGAPPNLRVSALFEEPSGNHLLDAEETGTILLSVYNTGRGDAFNLVADLNPLNRSGLRIGKVPIIYRLPTGGRRTIRIPIIAGRHLATREVEVKIELFEANGFDLQEPAQFIFGAQAVQPPDLLVDVGIDDRSGNGQIEPRELVTVTARIRNQGDGDAWEVTASVEIAENIFLARGTQTEFQLGSIRPGAFRDISFVVFTNDRAGSMKFTVEAKDSRERFNIIAPFSLEFHQPQRRTAELVR
ncbi:MAG: CARDB domain-containing protein, partial [Candidatus Electryoneaceae bacterium]|nr:CARDB domain-containing protein [Candidatus Electryoneaceae bacterium]